MSKLITKEKVIVLICILVASIFIIVMPSYAYTSEEIESKAQEANKLIEQYQKSSYDDINTYSENVDNLRESLIDMVLQEENAENKIELQKIKLSVTKLRLNFDEMLRINSLESKLVKYIGYQSQILKANEGNGIDLLRSTNDSTASGNISFRGTDTGVDFVMSETWYILCQQHGGSLSSVVKSPENQQDGEDATLFASDNEGNITYSKYIEKLYQRGTLLEDTLVVQKVRQGFADTNFGLPNYARTGYNGQESSIYFRFETQSNSMEQGTTRTIANFKASSRILETGEAYILAHSQKYNTTDYPAYVQEALWLYQQSKGSSAGETISNGTWSGSEYAEDADGEGQAITDKAQQLVAESLKAEEVLGTESFDITNTTNNFTTIYSASEKCSYIGPFSLDYTRETIVSTDSVVEKLQKEKLENKVDGLIEFSGINKILCYDENEKIISNVGFVISNKGQRQQGDGAYKFPYPNEEFYIKIPDNSNSTGFKSMTVEVFNLMVEGTGYDLNGTYKLQEFDGIAIPVECTEEDYPRTCEHGEITSHQVQVGVDPITGLPIYEICEGPFDYCPYHETTERHVKERKNYVMALGEFATKPAQKLLGVKNATIKLIFNSINLKVDQSNLIDLEGIVWDDEHSGKESDNNGIKDNNEKGIKGVKVTAVLDGKDIKSTYTDNKGKWKLEKLKPAKYDIQFEYDGQTYKSTKISAGKLEQTSKATESEIERQAFNDKFYEITNNKAISKNGALNTLQYNILNNESKIITRNASTNIPLELYKIKAKTSNNGKYYIQNDLVVIGTKDVVIGGKTYKALYPEGKNINLGLVKRAEVDVGLSIDVYKANIRIKEVFQEFTYDRRNINEFIDGITNKIGNEVYENLINRSDYNWSWDNSLISIYPTPDTAELQVYIDYKIVIRNQSQTASAQITELVNYYDQELIYKESTPVNTISSWIVTSTGDDTETTGVQEEIKWTSTSKYGTTQTSPNYNVMYTTDLEGKILKPGEIIEIHSIYAVKKDGKIIMDENDEGKKNIVEITGYRTYVNNKVEGKIDRDSNPGNATITDYSKFEDDTDKAPYFKLIFDPNKSNIIEGNVWEDLRTETLDNNQIIGDGIRTPNEPNIGGVIVDLVEIYNDPATNTEVERVVAQTTTAYNSNGVISDGGYRFTDIPQGTYQIRFAYGTEEQLTKNLKYNGQDYQATIVNGKIEQSKGAEVEIVFVIDVSGSMSGSPINDVKRALTGKDGLLKSLFSTIPDIQMGLVKFASSASKVSNLTNNEATLINAVNSLNASGGTNIPAGINVATGMFSNDKDKKKIMVLLTDGYSMGDTKSAIINAADKYDIYPISILVGIGSYVQNIFGTPENPIRGAVYSISSSNIVSVFINDIYADIEEYTTIMENRSYALEDVEKLSLETNQIESRTRVDSISAYKNMQYGNAMVVSTEYIDTLSGGDRQVAISQLANSTYVTATTNKLRVKENVKTGQSYIRQINLGLTERPKVKLELEEKIKGIQLILSDGTTLIDTQNGLNNYVQGLGREQLPISISLDSELQQGATIKVIYEIKVKNIGEIDTLESYFNHSEETKTLLNTAYSNAEKALLTSYFNNAETVEKVRQSTIPTQISKVYDYINSNMIFRQEENSDWQLATDTSVLSDEVKENVINNKLTIITTNRLNNKVLYPEGSIEAKQGMSSSISTTLILSKVISPQDNQDQLVYDNASEIVQRYNAVGRRNYNAVPGNYVPYNIATKLYNNIDEVDCDKAQEIKIVPPYGQMRIYYILIASVIMILALGVVLIKKYVLGKTKM